MTTDQTLHNWAGNIAYSTAQLHTPSTIEAAHAIASQADKIKVLGSRHSFNHIADSDDKFLSLANLNKVVSLDREKQTVTVEGGIKYGELAVVLHHDGFALHNMASLPHISVAGAIATATHGSGEQHGNLATAVVGLEILTAQGDLLTLTRDDPAFPGVVVNLGGLGIVTKVTLKLLPTFDMRQYVYLELPFNEAIANFDTIMGYAYSVSLFSEWNSDTFDQVWIKQHVNQPPLVDRTFFGAKAATQHYHPMAAFPPEPATRQLGIEGAWYERLPHFRMAFMPGAGAELQTEYFVARHHAVEALGAMNEIRETIAPVLIVGEVRTIAADDLWMSPCYQQDSVAIHFTWHPDWAAVQKVLPIIERQLAPFDAVPHWGKLFTMPVATVQARYERLGDFRALLNEFDAGGKFRNPFLERYVFGE